MNQSILLVSFGTSYPETREKTLRQIEADVREAFPERRVYHAWSSRIIRQKLLERDGEFIPDIPSAMEQMHRDGVTDVIIQPTYMINGIAYERMLADAGLCSSRFRQVLTGTSLLSSPEDCDAVIRVITEVISPGENEALVLMGHGTDHTVNAVYQSVNDRLAELGFANIFIGTVEGVPDLDAVFSSVEASHADHVILAPFLMVAGDHAQNDLNGDAKTSWKQRFLSAGYSVECRLRGLGEYPGIRQLILSHLRDTMALYS